MGRSMEDQMIGALAPILKGSDPVVVISILRSAIAYHECDDDSDPFSAALDAAVNMMSPELKEALGG